MTPPPPPSAELLLEHRSFLTRLSRSLVVDEQRAEDVVQATYLAVLERPPPPRVRLKAWLGAIARNLALRSRRTQARVRRREHRAAQPEALEATADVAARVETQKRVAAAVSTLSEPGRSAIVWRYFDGLSPTEIAAREGVGVRTIESRLRRAREALRTKLDATYGERATWRMALLPVAGWAGTASAHFTTAASSGVQGGAPTASVIGTAAAVGVTVMNVKMAIGIAVICAAGAFFAGRHLAPAQQELRADGGDGSMSDVGPLLGTEGMQRKQLEGALAKERERGDTLARRVEDLEARLAAGAAETGVEVVRKTGTVGAAYVPPTFAKAVQGVDWSEAGEAVTKLVPLLAKLETSFRDGREMVLSDVADISKWNSPLLKMALNVQEAEVPGTGTNGAFTHPAVIVNLLTATLAHAGKPLSAAQSEMLAELGNRFLADDERRMASYTEDIPVLQRTLEEAELKDRFYASADAILTEAQRNVVHPPEVRDRLGVDLFCSGVIWHPLSKPVKFSTRADLAPRMTALLVGQLEIPEDLRPVVEDATAQWARSFTDEELALADDPIMRQSAALSGGLVAGWARIELARAAARHMLALDRALLDRLPADSTAAKTIRRGAPYIGLPVKK